MFKIQDVTPIFIKVIHDIFSLIKFIQLLTDMLDYLAGLFENTEGINKT